MDMQAWSMGSADAAWRTILPLSRCGSCLSVIVPAGISWQGLLMSSTARDPAGNASRETGHENMLSSLTYTFLSLYPSCEAVCSKQRA